VFSPQLGIAADSETRKTTSERRYSRVPGDQYTRWAGCGSAADRAPAVILGRQQLFTETTLTVIIPLLSRQTFRKTKVF